MSQKRVSSKSYISKGVDPTIEINSKRYFLCGAVPRLNWKCLEVELARCALQNVSARA